MIYLINCSKGFQKNCEEYVVPCYTIDGEFCLDDILNIMENEL